jgi:hypothetical protein
MLVSQSDAAMQKFRRTPWRFQQTFVTPLKDIGAFAAAIVGSIPDVAAATVVVDQVVFPAKTLDALHRSPRKRLTRSSRYLSLRSATGLISFSRHHLSRLSFMPIMMNMPRSLPTADRI